MPRLSGRAIERRQLALDELAVLHREREALEAKIDSAAAVAVAEGCPIQDVARTLGANRNRIAERYGHLKPSRRR